MKCKICKTILTKNKRAVHLFSTHGLSFMMQGIEETPELLELWRKHRETGKKGRFKNKEKLLKESL